MNLEALWLAMGAALLTHTTAFRVGLKRVSIKVTDGPPQHFTFAQALTGAEAALLGHDGVVAQSGNVQIIVDNWPG